MNLPTIRRPGRPRSAEADEAILEATLDLLVERGIEGTSIELVARRAGVTRATIYRRYADKTALLIAAIHSSYPARPDELPEPRDVEEMLSWWAQALGEQMGERGHRLLRRLMTSLYDHPEVEETFTKVSIEPRNRWIRSTLERDRDRGRFPPDTDLEIVQQILTGAFATHLLTHPDGSTTRELEDFLLAVLRETRYRREP
jgi:AcrR family transcriptional regulator